MTRLRYDSRAIESKWQARWEDDKLYHAPDNDSRPKFYFLTMYPYPSGDYLHVGHWYAYVPADAAARYRRMRGFNVLFPVGFDAFGLPAENAAIERGVHPYRWTMANIERMRGQFRSMGASFDWSREIITCLPEYYEWNQWFFLKMYERGLAYRVLAPVDWCPHCNTSLAREQVIGPERLCERCDTPVVKKNLVQWFLKITAYAEELLDFSGIDWPDRVRTLQVNWIGKSVGVEFTLRVKDVPGASLRVFTTRPDTVYGMTFAVLAPEHPLVDRLTTAAHRAEVEAYKFKAARESDIERLSTAKERDGVFIGAYAINPMDEAPVPVFIADYVLLTYGTGAIQGVPAHDARDFDFAKKYGLPIPVVVAPPGWDGRPLDQAYLGDGTMVNSGPFTGLPSAEGWQRIADYMEAHGIGQRKANYRLHDWLISRQRYWGTPIPIIYCDACGTMPVPYGDLPVVLPEDAEFRPTGESPLRYHERFLNVDCPRCHRPARRETDTMDTFMDSSWYQYRYTSPHHAGGPFDPEKGKYWLPVDLYTGGVEHATMHLLYTRFWTKVMRDLGLVDLDEPMIRLFNQGIILGADGNRMSKSRGNAITADDLVQTVGADIVRGYLMFIGPWYQGGPWTISGMDGIVRFANRVWNLVTDPAVSVHEPPGPEEAKQIKRLLHSTIKRVTEDMEAFSFNTAIASIMELTNLLARTKDRFVRDSAWREGLRALLLMVAPIMPHLAEELWERVEGPYSIHRQPWPAHDPILARAETITLVLQVNGRIRDRIQVPADISAAEAHRMALENERIQRFMNGKAVADVIVVPGRLVNVVLR